MSFSTPRPLFEPVSRYFGFLCKEYGFRMAAETYASAGFGSGHVRMESEHYYIEFTAEGLGPEITVALGRIGQPSADLAWIFAYLTRQVASTPSGAAQWLYYAPHFSLSIWGDESVAWQLARLADVLQTMWPAIFIFLDMDGPRSEDYLAYLDKAGCYAAERAADGYRLPRAQLLGRESLGFAPQAEKSFAFLSAYGYRIQHADPVFVRFETDAPPGKPAGYVNVFHRLHSYQLGLQTGHVQNDPAFELNFDLEELAAWAGQPFQIVTAHSAAELSSALNRMSRLFRKCAAPALAGDPRLFEGLHARRIDAARRASRAWAERSRK